MTFEITVPPESSWVQIGCDEEGHPELSWTEPFTWTQYLLIAALTFGVVSFLGSVLQPLAIHVLKEWDAILRQGFPGGNPISSVLRVITLSLMTVVTGTGVLTICWTLYAVLRLPVPERLTFGPAMLRYESDGPLRLRRQVHNVPRSDLGKIRLDHVTEHRGMPPRRRLTIDYGGERIEIGKQLRERDREWLAELLRSWSQREQSVRSAGLQVPANSSVRVELDEQGWLRLAWRPSHWQPTAKWMGAAQLSVWLLVWGLIEIVVLLQIIAILMGHWGPLGNLQWVLLAVMLVWLPGWTFGGCVAIGYLCGLVRGPTMHYLTMSPSVLIYQPGWHFAENQFRSAPRRKIPLAELGNVRLEETEQGQRLIIDHGAEQVEIGPGLSNAEHEWLAEVLREWLHSVRSGEPERQET
jgi:hypothetical protein